MKDDKGYLTPEDYAEPRCLLCDEPYGVTPEVKSVPQQRIIQKMNDYMSRRDYAGAERHLKYWLEEAKLGFDKRGELLIQNELVGHFRKTANKEGAFESAKEALRLLKELDFEENVSAGTTYTNIATAFNAFGENEKSIELFEKAKQKGIHTCLDTSGIAFRKENVQKYVQLMKYTDLVMLDIKHIDDMRHRKLTGHSNERVLAFAKYLSDKGVPIWIRHVLVPTVTNNDVYLKALGRFIAGLKTLKAIDVLPYHTMAREKYERLGIDYKLGDTPAATKQQAAHARDVIMLGLKEALKNG